MKKTIHPSTARALNDRAVGVANSLEHWVTGFGEQMKAQNIERFPKQNIFDLKGDSNEQITFTRRDIRKFLMLMDENIERLRKFGKPGAGF